MKCNKGFSVGSFVEHATGFDDKVVFRGQTKQWQLVPSIGRDVDRSRTLWREKEILEEFKRESVPYINLDLKNDWQWLAVAQHNRLPTRLLDWTKNPLAALWFAVKDPALENNPGVVWALRDTEDMAIYNTSNQNDPFSIDRTYLYFPDHVFPFIQAQSGAFTIHHREGENPGRFPPVEEMKYTDLLLDKIEIPSEFFRTVQYQLFRIGISPASLFPGLPGIVEKIRYDNIQSADEGNG